METYEREPFHLSQSMNTALSEVGVHYYLGVVVLGITTPIIHCTLHRRKYCLINNIVGST